MTETDMARVNEIRYVGYGMPDIETERSFYRDIWRLREVAADDGMVYFTAEGGEELYVVRLRKAQRKRLDVIALATESSADVDELHRCVAAYGCQIVQGPHVLQSFGGGYGFRFFSKDGLPFEVSSDVARGSARELKRWEAIPTRISHIVLHSPNHKALTDFFVNVLGFRLSDWLGDSMSFLRCNEWHHRIGILPGPPCLNHVAYDMLTVDDMMRGISRLKQQDVELRWGPGRHTAGNNTFSYFTTPNEFAVEYTAELERIDEATWQPSTLTPSAQAMDQWGIGIGGPQCLPKPEQDGGVFSAAEV